MKLRNAVNIRETICKRHFSAVNTTKYANCATSIRYYFFLYFLANFSVIFMVRKSEARQKMFSTSGGKDFMVVDKPIYIYLFIILLFPPNYFSNKNSNLTDL